jgi:hypothetical protein
MKVYSPVFLYQLSFLLLSVARGNLIISEVVDATLNGGTLRGSVIPIIKLQSSQMRYTFPRTVI